VRHAHETAAQPGAVDDEKRGPAGVELIAIVLVCAAQAIDLRAAVHAGAGTRAAHATLRERIAPLVEDRPLDADIAAVYEMIDDGTLQQAAENAVGQLE
jgi:histidine ammonia-lyase